MEEAEESNLAIGNLLGLTFNYYLPNYPITKLRASLISLAGQCSHCLKSCPKRDQPRAILRRSLPCPTPQPTRGPRHAPVWCFAHAGVEVDTWPWLRFCFWASPAWRNRKRPRPGSLPPTSLCSKSCLAQGRQLPSISTLPTSLLSRPATSQPSSRSS